MAQLHYNEREYLKQRHDSKPLSLEENQIVVQYLNESLFNKPKDTEGYKLLQRFIYNYEKMQYREIINANVEYEIVESKMNDKNV